MQIEQQKATPWMCDVWLTKCIKENNAPCENNGCYYSLIKGRVTKKFTQQSTISAFRIYSLLNGPKPMGRTEIYWVFRNYTANHLCVGRNIQINNKHSDNKLKLVFLCIKIITREKNSIWFKTNVSLYNPHFWYTAIKGFLKN